MADRIITLDIRPNEAINESQLSKDMQMGRTPIREALGKLENDRLVVTKMRKGAFAAPVDASDFRQVSLIRHALEPVAAGLAAEHYHPGHAETLDQHLELLRSLRTRSLEQSELMRLHLAVHKLIYGLSMNRHLEDTLTRYAHLSIRLWSLLLERQPPVVERTLELAEILERIEANDSEQSRSLMDQHVRAFDNYLAGLR
ncbi:GntR family transcriptional regulator [Arthrobacter sp. NPDC057009]|uniref:GntR family transcriptional regulator n=1 Tax=Arthrobacter sp. NPDC057009 TaxID=3345996 RepID=UPI003638EF83